LILRKFFGGKKETKNSGKRNLVSVCQLLPGDLVTFKHRQVIPPALQGSTLDRCPDIKKISKLGFKKKYNLSLGLSKTINWYLNQ